MDHLVVHKGTHRTTWFFEGIFPSGRGTSFGDLGIVLAGQGTNFGDWGIVLDEVVANFGGLGIALDALVEGLSGWGIVLDDMVANFGGWGIVLDEVVANFGGLDPPFVCRGIGPWGDNSHPYRGAYFGGIAHSFLLVDRECCEDEVWVASHFLHF